MYLNYLKIALKVLFRRKFFTFISLFGIVFTLVALIIVSTILDNMFGTIPPEVHQDRTLYVWEVSLKWKEIGAWSNGAPGYEFLTEMIDIGSLPHVEYASVFSALDNAMSFKGNQRHSLSLKRTDGNFWKIMEFTFLEGGPISDEHEQNADFVAVVSESTRRKLFGNKSVYGKTIDLNGRDFRIIGVVKDAPRYRVNPYADVWVPISTAKSGSYRKDGIQGRFTGAVLVSDKSFIPQVKEEFNVRLTRTPVPAKYEKKIYSYLESYLGMVARGMYKHDDILRSDFTKRFISRIILLMIVFMLVPSINLISINVSRIYERSSEIGIRKAFGASSRELIIQFVFENILLTLIGGLISVLVSVLLLNFIRIINIFPEYAFALNARVLLYGFGITLFFGIMSGLYPAWKMSRYNPVESFQQKII